MKYPLSKDEVSDNFNKKEIQKQNKSVRGWIGLIIQDIDENLAEAFGLNQAEGTLVSGLTTGSPAEKAGFKQGDVVLTLNNSPLTDVSDLRNRIAMTAPGTSIILGIMRDGSHHQVSVIIAEQPSDFSEREKEKTKPIKLQSGFVLDKLGLTL